MPKAYWVGHVDVKDAEAYSAYIAANKAAFDKYGAKFIIRGGPIIALEGRVRSRCVVIEFPDLETARACYHSREYQAAKALREPVSLADLIIVEGYGED